MLAQTEARFEYLTGIRGIAAIVVLLSHIIQVFWLRYEDFPAWAREASSISSTYAVIIFFVLSGFLIAHSIEENTRRNQGILDIKDFIAARFARIYPPFIFSIIVSICIFTILTIFAMPGVASQLKFSGDVYSARDIIKITTAELALSLMMLQGLLDINGPLWSLYIEAKLYLIFICFHLLLIRRNLMLAISGFMFVTYLSLRFNPEFLRYTVIWLTGCMAYYLFGVRGRSLKKHALASGSLVTLIILYDLMVHFSFFPLVFQSSRIIFIDFVIAVVISGVILFFRFRPPFANEVGAFSYSLYVTHFPVLLLIQSVLIALGSTSLPISIAASILAFFSAIIVGQIGGLIEARKRKIQAATIVVWSRTFQLLKAKLY